MAGRTFAVVCFEIAAAAVVVVFGRFCAVRVVSCCDRLRFVLVDVVFGLTGGFVVLSVVGLGFFYKIRYKIEPYPSHKSFAGH